MFPQIRTSLLFEVSALDSVITTVLDQPGHPSRQVRSTNNKSRDDVNAKSTRQIVIGQKFDRKKNLFYT